MDSLSTTATPASNCPKCGTRLQVDTLDGLCPKCLMVMNLQQDTALNVDGPTIGLPLPPEELAPHFPQLEILECLGRGGMGVVYKARQKSLNRLVALKLLAPERVADRLFAERFTREAHALAALNHPNIVTIHDFGEAGGYYFLLMEFVDGVNLRQLLRAKRLSPEEALSIVPTICDALQYAHDRGIVHRDIKPENLLLDKSSRIKIADFGIARMLAEPANQTGGEGAEINQSLPRPNPDTSERAFATSKVGTPGYMAPEQSSHPGKVDARADIYSLGVVFYEMLTGELPGSDWLPPSRKIGIDVRIDEIVLRALEKRPEMRFATAAEFKTGIQQAKEDPANAETSVKNEPQDGFASAKLKTGQVVFSQAQELSTFKGQLFHQRQRGHYLLNDRELVLVREGKQWNIPLNSITELGLANFPTFMNPVGLQHVRLQFEIDGLKESLVISPMRGIFAKPGEWNERVAEFHDTLGKAVLAVTGRFPKGGDMTSTQSQANNWVLMPLVLIPLATGVFLALILILGARQRAGRSNALAVVPPPSTLPTPPLPTTREGIAFFSPIVGEEIGTNEFRASTVLNAAGSVALLTWETKTTTDSHIIPELSCYLIHMQSVNSGILESAWAIQPRGKGQMEVRMRLSGRNGDSMIHHTSLIDGLAEYTWKATPQNRSYWVAPGEWQVNETNTLILFEGIRLTNPSQRCEIRLHISVFMLPETFTRPLTSFPDKIRSGYNWRAELGISEDLSFPVQLWPSQTNSVARPGWRRNEAGIGALPGSPNPKTP